MKLKTGSTRRVHANNTRGAAFHGMGAFVGVGKTQRAHVYTAASLPVGPDDYKKIDAEKLAHELEVDMCAVNSGRFWMMDEIDFAGGDTVDFHGVQMNWAGDMTGAEMIGPDPERLRALPDPAQHHLDVARRQARAPAARAGRHGLGAPGVHQGGRPEPHPDNLDTLGGKFKDLPKGWTFEVKVLDKELPLDTGRAGGWAAIIRDEFHCTYQGCGYGTDKSANYIP